MRLIIIGYEIELHTKKILKIRLFLLKIIKIDIK